MLFETSLLAITTFIATVGPFDIAFLFAALTAGMSARDRRTLAWRSVGIATLMLVTFALVGKWLLDVLGISLASLQTAGGILLLLMGIDLVFARHSGAQFTTPEEDAEAKGRNDIAVFPLAMPLIAGPGSLGAVILLMANAHGDIASQTVIVGCLLAVMVMTLGSLLLASQLQKFLGITGTQVISRIFGFLLTALAVQFIFNGIEKSGLLG